MAQQVKQSWWSKFLQGTIGTFLNAQIRKEIENNPALFLKTAEDQRLNPSPHSRFNVYRPIPMDMRQAYFRFNRFLQGQISWRMYFENPEAAAILRQLAALSTYRLSDGSIFKIQIKHRKTNTRDDDLSAEVTGNLHDVGFAARLADTNKRMLIEGSHFQELIWDGSEITAIQPVDGPQEGMITEKVYLKDLGAVWATYDSESGQCVSVRLPEDVLHFQCDTMYLDPDSKALYGIPHLMQSAKGHEYYVNALKKMADIRAASEYERHHGFPDNTFASREEFERFVQWVEDDNFSMERLKNGVDVMTTGKTTLVESQLEGLNQAKSLDLATVDQGLVDLGGVADGILPGRGKNVNRETLSFMFHILDRGLLTSINDSDTVAIRTAVRTWLIGKGYDPAQYQITVDYGAREYISLTDRFNQDWQMLNGGRLDPDVFDSRWGSLILSQNPAAQARIDDMFARQRQRETVNVFDSYTDRVDEEIRYN